MTPLDQRSAPRRCQGIRVFGLLNGWFEPHKKGDAVTQPGEILHVYDKFCKAVHLLAVGEGTVIERLPEACREFSAVRANEFPESLRSDFEWIQTRFADAQRDRTLALGGFTLAEGREIAERIVRLHDAVGDSLSDSTPDA